MAQVRGPDGKYIRTVDHARRSAQAAELKARGWSYQRIADHLGYGDKGAAYRDVQRILVETITEPANELRQLELTRLDTLYEAALGVLERQHITVSNGKVVTLDEMPIPDDAPILQAIDRCLRIQERRAKLLGLDAPAKVEVITLETLDAEIRRLSDELAESGGVDLGSVDDAAGTAPPQG